MENFLRRFILYPLTIFGISFFTAFFWLSFKGKNLAKESLEAKGAELCQCDFKIGQIIWNPLHPLKARFVQVSSVSKTYALNLPKIDVNLILFPKGTSSTNLIDVRAILHESDLVFFPRSEAEMKILSEKTLINRLTLVPLFNALKPTNIDLDFKNFKIKLYSKFEKFTGLKLTNLNLTFDGEKSEFLLKAMGNVQVFESKHAIQNEDYLSEFLPFSIVGAKIFFAKDVFILSKSKAFLYDLPIEIAGKADVIGSVDLNLNSTILDAETLPRSKLFPYIKNLKGGFRIMGSVRQNAPKLGRFDLPMDLGFASEITISASDFIMSIDLLTNDSRWLGDIRINGELKGSNAKPESHITANWNLDLSDLRLEIDKILNKPEGVKLTSKGEFEYFNDFSISNFSIALDAIKLMGSGRMDPASGDYIANFNVPLTDLRGIEKFLPMLKEQPLIGQIEVDGSYGGNFKNPLQMSLDVSKIYLNNVSGFLNYSGPSILIKGPFQVNVDGNLQFQDLKVHRGLIQTRFDLTKMEISIENIFRKNKYEVFDLNIVGMRQNEDLISNNSYLRTNNGVLIFNGLIPLPPEYKIKSKIASQGIGIESIKKWWPQFQQVIPNGTIKGDLNLSGHLNTADLKNSNIVSDGHLDIVIPRFEILGQEKSESKNENITAKTGSLMPKYDVLNKANITANLNVLDLDWQRFKFNRMSSSLTLQDGILTGNLNFNDIMGGQVYLNNFEVAAFNEDPIVTFKNLKANGVHLDEVLTAFLPKWRGMASGILQLNSSGSSYLPISPRFISGLNMKGLMVLNGSNFGTNQLLVKVYDKLKKNGAHKSLFNSSNFKNEQFSIQGPFDWKSKAISVDDLLARGSGSELYQQLKLKGFLNYQKELKFEGTYSYVKNKKTKERIQVPFNTWGNLDSPQISLSKSNVRELAGKKSRN